MKWLYLSIFCLSACSGYRFSRNLNPLSQYGIKKVCIPMFVNRTTLGGGIAPIFTKSFKMLLANYKNLKVCSQEEPGLDADAVLIGEILSPRSLRETYRVNQRVFTEDIDDLDDELSNRNPFFIPRTNSVRVNLRLTLVKNPSVATYKELEMLPEALRAKHPRVIFDHNMPLKTSFTREIFGFEGENLGGVTNFSQNRGKRVKSYYALAQSAAKNFQELVLYAF